MAKLGLSELKRSAPRSTVFLTLARRREVELLLVALPRRMGIVFAFFFFFSWGGFFVLVTKRCDLGTLEDPLLLYVSKFPPPPGFVKVVSIPLDDLDALCRGECWLSAPAMKAWDGCLVLSDLGGSLRGRGWLHVLFVCRGVVFVR